MPQITNKIKLFGSFTVVFLASMLLSACGKEKQTEGSESGAAADTTEQIMDQKMSPDSLPPDSLPVIDTSASTRPEGSKT